MLSLGVAFGGIDYSIWEKNNCSPALVASLTLIVLYYVQYIFVSLQMILHCIFQKRFTKWRLSSNNKYCIFFVCLVENLSYCELASGKTTVIMNTLFVYCMSYLHYCPFFNLFNIRSVKSLFRNKNCIYVLECHTSIDRQVEASLL